jgi:dTDP-4-dehydrorhamnose 3,5-epimerase
MKVVETPLEGVLVIEPKVFEDSRGYFFEAYNKAVFEKAGIHAEFVQDNQSLSQKGVLRGMHFQNPPYAQGKLVRVIKGAVQDVVVDIRSKSKTYGQYFSIELTEENKKMLWVPPGFAHGFLTLADNTVFFYKCTNYYNKESEGAILWNDKDLSIPWKITEGLIMSEKDKNATPFKDFVTKF